MKPPALPLVLFPLVVLIPAVLAGLQRAGEDSGSSVGGALGEFAWCFAWFGIPALVIRFVILRRPQHTLAAVGFALAIWLWFSLIQQSFNFRHACFNASEDLPCVLVSVVPVVGPVLMVMSLNENVRIQALSRARKEYVTERRVGETSAFGYTIIREYVDPAAVGLMFSFAVTLLRWHRPPETGV